jgi:branched-chain amino acid transport system permease protein
MEARMPAVGELLDVVQILVAGIAQGCVYGLIALGFVLIYKATEQVNFAQGDLMMVGAFIAFTFIELLGMSWWLGSLLALLTTGLFGFLLDAIVVRRIIGQPQFAVVILTIALGFMFRSMAGAIWGADPVVFDTPYSGGLTISKSADSKTVLGYTELVIIFGTAALACILYLFFRFTRIGVAMQASSQNQLAAYYMGVPVKFVFSLIWAISAAVSCIAGILLAPKIAGVSTEMGFLAITAFAAAVIGGFGSLPGAIIGGLIIGITEQLASAYLPDGISSAISPISGFIIMLVVLVLRPNGLFAQVQVKKV